MMKGSSVLQLVVLVTQQLLIQIPHSQVNFFCMANSAGSTTSSSTTSFVKVKTLSGMVQGFRKSVLSRDVFHFLGVPYAKPPIGPLRFQNPEPKPSWSHVWDATKYPPTCYQSIPEPRDAMNAMSRMWLNNTAMSEDCLYLNVWTDQLPQEGLVMRGRPVMVWIYGGGFTSGTSTLEVYNGAILASKMNVVVVSMQYRVGPFGFLYLGTMDIPGNQGLMDQLMALEWVKANIDKFGGDPKKVTLFGESAGAASISLHLLSDRARPLFQQAIMQSASALAWWALESPSSAKRKTALLAQISGCHVAENINQKDRLLAECLRSLDAQTLIVNQWEISFAEPTSTRNKKLREFFQNKPAFSLVSTAGLYFVVPFKPVVTSSYLDDWPKELLRQGRLRRQHRIMMGTNKDEGIYFLIEGMRHYFMKDREGGVLLPTEFRYGSGSLDPLDILALYIMDENFLNSFLIQATVFQYQIPSRAFESKDWTSKELIDALDELTGDYNFKCPVVDFANAYASDPNPQVFLYSFEHRTRSHTWPLWTGVMHGYEIEYVFGMPFNEKFQKEFYAFTDEERKLSEQIMRFWTNFAATGSPNNHPGEFHTKSKENFWERYETPPNSQGNGFGGSSQGFYGNSGTMPGAGSNNAEQEEAEFQKFRRHIVLGLNLTMGKNMRRKECIFWSHFLPQLRNRILEAEQPVVPDSLTCRNAMKAGG